MIPSFVLGAFPKFSNVRYRAYNKEYQRIATNYMANAIVPYLNPKTGPDIINFISTEEQTGKSTIIAELADYWEQRGLRIRVISWHDSNEDSYREFILSNKLSDIYDYDNEDIILVEHQSLRRSAIPVGLLREASLNIVVIKADAVWRDIDKIAFDRLKGQVDSSPMALYLTNTKREVAESFLGILPPHTAHRKFIYKLLQFGLTSS